MRTTVSRDDFERWLFDMDDAIAEFGGLVGGQVVLDGSDASLATLERWLLARYPTKEALTAPSEEPILDGAARYLGETLRRRVGGIWDIVLDDPNFIYGALPILRVPNNANVPFSPYFTVRLAIRRRSGGLFASVVSKAVEHARGQ